MWHDRDPYREQQHVPDTFWLVVAALLFAACGLVWLIGQVAAILFGAHEHLPVRLVDMLGVLLRLPGTWDDPAKAWPPSSQPLLPGPVGMYAAAVLTFWIPAFAYGLLVRLLSPRARRRRKQRGAKWASLWQLRRLLVLGPTAGADHPGPPRPHPRPAPRPPLPGRGAMPLGPGLRTARLVQDPRPGHPGDPGVAGQPGHHLHQTRRPAGHLRPPGQPRRRLGLRPPRAVRGAGSTVDPAGLLPAYADARRIGRMLAEAADVQGHKADDANYWQLLGAKLLSVLLFAAAGTGRSMADVARWVDVQDVDDVAQALMEIGNQQALDAWAACTSRPDNTMGSRLRHRRDPPRRLRRPHHCRLGRGLRPGHRRAADRGQQHPLPLRPRQSSRSGSGPCSSSWCRVVIYKAEQLAAAQPGGMLDPRLFVCLDEAGQLRRHQEAPPARHHRPRPGHPAADHLARRGPAPAPLRPPRRHRPERPSGQAAAVRPGRPGLPRAGLQAGRRRSRHPDLRDDRRRRPRLDDRVDGLSAAVAARRRCGSSSPAGRCWCMGICRRSGSGCGPGSAPAAWSRWPWPWTPPCRTRPWPSTTSPRSSRCGRPTRARRPPNGTLPHPPHPRVTAPVRSPRPAASHPSVRPSASGPWRGVQAGPDHPAAGGGRGRGHRLLLLCGVGHLAVRPGGPGRLQLVAGRRGPGGGRWAGHLRHVPHHQPLPPRRQGRRATAGCWSAAAPLASIGGNVAHAQPNLVAQGHRRRHPAGRAGHAGRAQRRRRRGHPPGRPGRRPGPRGRARPARPAPAGHHRPTHRPHRQPGHLRRRTFGSQRRALPAGPSQTDRATVGARLQAAYAQQRPDGQPWTARTLAEAAGCGRSSAAGFLQRQRPPAAERTR